MKPFAQRPAGLLSLLLTVLLLFTATAARACEVRCELSALGGGGCQGDMADHAARQGGSGMSAEMAGMRMLSQPPAALVSLALLGHLDAHLREAACAGHGCTDAPALLTSRYTWQVPHLAARPGSDGVNALSEARALHLPSRSGRGSIDQAAKTPVAWRTTLRV